MRTTAPRPRQGWSEGIRWATPDGGHKADELITWETLQENAIFPRHVKLKEAQQLRVKAMAEVFTPSWLCNRMNNFLDEEWFGRRGVFNTENPDHTWQSTPSETPIAMPEGRTWQDYVRSTRLEITCGEAPFIVSPYDTVTGNAIPIGSRIGVLDRKLRIVGEHCKDKASWLRAARVAFESAYGYEWQGDSLFLARCALLQTFIDYFRDRFKENPPEDALIRIAEIISWNFWQMDGLRGVVPDTCHPEVKKRAKELELFPEEEKPKQYEQSEPCPGCWQNDLSLHNGYKCRVRKWAMNFEEEDEDAATEYLYCEIGTPQTSARQYPTNNSKPKPTMKFDYVIGNPPYQEETKDTSDKPVYDLFMEQTFRVANKVELITPARFLFNAGKTPKEWNKKMLRDRHFKVLHYEQKSDEVFSNTDIKGGVAITYRDANGDFGAIEVFTAFPKLNTILDKVHIDGSSISNIVYGQTKFDLNALYADYPQYKTIIGSNSREKRLTAPIFSQLDLFSETPRNESDVAIIGLIGNKRVKRYIPRKYIDEKGSNFDKWKVFLPKSNGSGAIGEVLSTPLIGEPLIGSTQTFISIGAFDTREEAEAALKYIKSKFARTMLGILKVTQDNPVSTWAKVPLQDFTEASDINWKATVREIDQQLYRKYGLDKAERAFIEEKVREME